MKKTVILATLVSIFAACASTPKVATLTDTQLTAMSPTQVNAYYADQNKSLLDNVLYNYGGDAFEAAEPITANMNNDLANLSRQQITRGQYNAGVQTIVAKYQQQLNAAVKANKVNEE